MDEALLEVEELDGDEIGQENSDRGYRAAGITAFVGMIALLGAMVLFNGFSDASVVTAYTVQADSIRKAEAKEGHKKAKVLPPPMVLSRMPLLDTVYTTDNLYLDVNLKRQSVTVHFRDGGSRTFRISSGNPAIREGIATPAGLFTVQNMQPMAISKQFNDARLHHWIGIQGGVGFHGLDGNGYYGTLGVRPSSHGCVRMAREEIAEMYKLVHPGALIMVHNESPARVIAFCDPSDTADATLIDSASVYNKALGKERLRALYNGTYWTAPVPRIVHLARQRVRWGMEIGDRKKIVRQELPRMTYTAGFNRFLAAATTDRTWGGPMDDATLAMLRKSSDSLTAHQRAEWKREEKKGVEFGE
jgi:hypothetical protein